MTDSSLVDSSLVDSSLVDSSSSVFSIVDLSLFDSSVVCSSVTCFSVTDSSLLDFSSFPLDAGGSLMTGISIAVLSGITILVSSGSSPRIPPTSSVFSSTNPNLKRLIWESLSFSKSLLSLTLRSARSATGYKIVSVKISL